MFTVQVVIKAVFDGRPDGKFYIWEQVLNSLSHNMGSGMSDSMQTFLGVRDDKFNFCILFQLFRQVLIFTINYS